MHKTKESGKAQRYADQVRNGVVLSRENLARFIEEQEVENQRLREALHQIAESSGLWSQFARNALEDYPE